MSKKKGEPCLKCNQDVLSHERLVPSFGELYHVECFRCGKCKRKMSPNSVGKINGVYYCKNDYEILQKSEKIEEKIELKIEKKEEKVEVKDSKPLFIEKTEPKKVTSTPTPEPKKFVIKNEKFKDLNDTNSLIYPSKVFGKSSEHSLYLAKLIENKKGEVGQQSK